VRFPRLSRAGLIVLASVLLGLAFLSARDRRVFDDSGPTTSGQPIDGIPCKPGEQLTYHGHVALRIVVNGQAQTVPAAIGIVNPGRVRLGSISGGDCLYWLHTHDSTGTIHVEAPTPRPFILGTFFDIWGQPLTSTRVGAWTGVVSADVDGHEVTGDPRAIPLVDGTTITLWVITR
jgi:hypothetical protein